MRTSILILITVLACPNAFSQDEQNSDWQIMPGIVVVKYFPGKAMPDRHDYYLTTYPPMFVPSYAEHKYEGTGVQFSARCFSEEIKPLALTFGAGATWYYRPERTYVYSASSQQGIGEVMGYRDFTAFPLSIGVQAVFPYAARNKLMMFAGIEGSLNFVSGDLDVNQQAKAGFTVLGGFAVKFFEFGVRYTSFSDIKNLGAHFGLRFKSFGI